MTTKSEKRPKTTEKVRKTDFSLSAPSCRRRLSKKGRHRK